MSINRNESFTLKFVCHIFIVVFIYTLLLLFSTLRIYYLIYSSFQKTQKESLLPLPYPQEKYYKGMYFYKV